MKVVTANFISCAVKSCKISPSAFPLHFQDAELEQQELDLQPEFIRNILPRIDWDALRVTASELGFPTIPETKPEGDALDEQTLKDLHTLLLETHVVEGKLVCGSCGHEYKIKEGIANFLLPSHLGAIHNPLLPACLPLDFNDLSQSIEPCGVRVPLTDWVNDSLRIYLGWAWSLALVCFWGIFDFMK